jgi:hypothetical protein
MTPDGRQRKTVKRLLFTTALLFFAAAVFGQIAGERPLATPVYAPVTAYGPVAIASNGDGFLAAWSDQRDRGSIYAARIAHDGTVLDPRGIFLANALSAVNVAWTGDRYLVVWNDFINTNAAQVDIDGRVIASRLIVKNAQIYGKHVLASNGKVTVLVTGTGDFVLDADLNVISFDRFGEAVYPTGSGEFVLTAAAGTMLLDSSGRYVTRTFRRWPGIIACRAGNCVTAFNNTHGGLSVAPFDLANLIVGPALDVPINYNRFDLAATASGFILASSDNLLQRIGPDGQPLGAPTILPGAPAGELAMASNGRDVALVHTSNTAGPPILTSLIITPASSTQPVDVSVSANAQHDVAIAKGISNYLAVWTEKDGTYAGRLSLDGLPLDGRGILLSSITGKPSVVFDGASYLVVPGSQFYLNAYQNVVLQIDPATATLRSMVTIGGTDFRISSNGSARVGVWIDTAGGLDAAFLAPTGAIASMPVLIAVPTPRAPLPNDTLTNLSVTWNGAIWFVAWEEKVHSYPIPLSPPPPYYVPPSAAIRGARLSAALTLLDTKPITISEPSNRSVQGSRVASDGHDFLVAWSNNGVRVRRIPSTGVSNEEETLLVAGSVQDLVWDGAAYDLAFYTGGPYYYIPGHLAVARLRATGQPIETLVISATSGDDRSASLLPIGNGSILAAYTRVAYEQLYAGVERAFVTTPRAARGRADRKEIP